MNKFLDVLASIIIGILIYFFWTSITLGIISLIIGDTSLYLNTIMFWSFPASIELIIYRIILLTIFTLGSKRKLEEINKEKNIKLQSRVRDLEKENFKLEKEINRLNKALEDEYEVYEDIFNKENIEKAAEIVKDFYNDIEDEYEEYNN